MTRLLSSWRALGREQHATALVALGLFVSMLLPWYSKTDTIVVRGAATSTEQSLSAFQAFSFVEAAVLLVGAGVLAMLFARGEDRDFQLPGGDGVIVTLAGAWAAILIFYRLLDKPGLQGNAKISSTVGVQWGIFIALLLALGLVYCGGRIRASDHGAAPMVRPRGRGPQPGARRDRGAVGYEDDSYEDADDMPGRPGAGGEQLTAATRRVQASRADTEPTSPSAQVPAPAPATAQPPAGAAAEAAAGPYAHERRPRSTRPRFPPAPSRSGESAGGEQMSFEDAPSEDE
jgi:hypothetical protein